MRGSAGWDACRSGSGMVVGVRIQRDAGGRVPDASGIVDLDRRHVGAAHWHALAQMAVSNRCAADRSRCRCCTGREGDEIVLL